MPRVLFVFVIAVFLGGCSGGSEGSRPPVTVAPLPIASPPAPGSTATHAAAAHFTITIPAATAASTRRAAYLSSATQSVVITLTAVNGVPFTGSPSEVASNLTPSNPNCSGTPLTCTVAVPGFTGTDTFAIATYDAQQPATLAATPAGNLLSRATLTATVVANATNTVAVVLNGVPASITIAGLPSGTAGTPLAAQPFVVMVDDAAGRTIIGAFANPVVLSDGDTSGATTVATSGSDSPPAGQLLSSSDVTSVSYTGLAIAPVNIGASAPNATANTANFAPALQPVVTTAPLNGATPEVALTMSSATQSFGASEIGWTNAPYNKTLSVTAAGACSTIGSVSPASGTSFTATVAGGSPAAGTCTLAVTDFPGGSAFTVTLAYVTGTQNYGSPGTSNFTVPFGVSQVTIAAAGGQGHGGGGGGSVTATIPVTAGETLAVYVGGASGGGGGGINGGGNSGGDGCGSGGGGASDVRQGGSTLTNRVVVAGGGGGGGCDNGYGGGGGGAGGGSTGGAGQTVTTAGGGVGGSGGASGVGGAGGAGGVGTVNGGNAGSGVLGTGGVGGLGGGGSFTGLGGSGGGGGYYGGGGGGGGAGNCCGSPGIGGGGGAGGSSYVEPGGTTITNVAGTQGGDGQVIVSW